MYWLGERKKTASDVAGLGGLTYGHPTPGADLGYLHMASGDKK